MLSAEVQPTVVRSSVRARVREAAGDTTEVLRGPDAIRRHAVLLEEFLPACDDADSLGSMAVWMRDALAQHGIPVATLVFEHGVLQALLLAVELEVLGCRTRLAFSGNITGHCGFFTPEHAPRDQRERRMLLAADALIASGIVGLLLSVKQPRQRSSASTGTLLRTSRIVARSTRDVYDTFDLQADFDGSLSRLGAHTRRNLRYYRRRADRELGCQFYQRLEGANLRDALLDLRDSMKDELSPDILKNRIAHVARRPDAFCMGVRSEDGRWLSWVSGWRAGRNTYIDWQCNRDGLPRYSLSTVMRSHLIEVESLRAQEQIRFLGGTPHTMHYGFREDSCTDLLLTPGGVAGAVTDAALRMVVWLRQKARAARHPAETEAGKRAPRRQPLIRLLVRMAGVMSQSGTT